MYLSYFSPKYKDIKDLKNNKKAIPCTHGLMSFLCFAFRWNSSPACFILLICSFAKHWESLKASTAIEQALPFVLQKYLRFV